MANATAPLALLVHLLTAAWVRPTGYTADPARRVRRFTVEGVEGTFEATNVLGPGYSMMIYSVTNGIGRHIGMANWQDWGQAADAVRKFSAR